MFTTQAAAILAFLATSPLVSAHGHVASWTINGEEKGGFNPSNKAQYGATAERPTDNSDQGFVSLGKGATLLACGGASAGTGLETWDLDAGSTVTAHWNTWPESHKGPIQEFMAKCPGTTCDGVDAGTLDWFKISEVNYDATTKTWPTDKIAKGEPWSFKIPSDIANGNYLVRHALIGMHGAGDPQIYPACFQANVVGGGSAVPKDTATFATLYDINPAFQKISIYYGDDLSLFVPPGPPVYGGGGTASAPAPAPTSLKPSAATSSSAAVPAVTPSTSAAPVKPSGSSAASVKPSASSAAPVKPSASTGAPVKPSSSAAPVKPSASSASASVKPPASTPSKTATSPGVKQPATTAPATGGSLGGPAPAITENGDKFVVDGASYNFEGDAKYASCMSQMNKCKNWANALPNAEVGAAFTQCDSQASTCFSGSKKRAVVNRYAKRALALI